MTRACIKLSKSGEEDLYFYSHCDGYPTKVLVDIIHMKNKDYYDLFVEELMNKYEETNGFHGDSDFNYIIDWDEQIIETRSARWNESSKSGLLRKDMLYTDCIEIED